MFYRNCSVSTVLKKLIRVADPGGFYSDPTFQKKPGSDPLIRINILLKFYLKRSIFYFFLSTEKSRLWIFWYCIITLVNKYLDVQTGSGSDQILKPDHDPDPTIFSNRVQIRPDFKIRNRIRLKYPDSDPQPWLYLGSFRIIWHVSGSYEILSYLAQLQSKGKVYAVYSVA